MKTTKYRADIEFNDGTVEVLHGILHHRINGYVYHVEGKEFEIILPLTSNVKFVTVTEDEQDY